MRKTFCIGNALKCLLTLFMFSCSSSSNHQSHEIQFQELTQQYFAELWPLAPEFAASLGNHDFDHVLQIPSKENKDRRIAFSKRYLRLFSEFDPKKLSQNTNIEKNMIINSLKSTIWYLEEFKPDEWTPSNYNIGNSLANVMQGNSKSREKKLDAVLSQLKSVDLYYKTAAQNIKRPTREHTLRAIKENKGVIKYLDSVIAAEVKESAFSNEDKKAFLSQIGTAKKSVSNYLAFLNRISSNPSLIGGFRSFRIGSKLYGEKFQHDLETSFTPKQAYLSAKKEKQVTLKKMHSLAKTLHRELFANDKAPRDKFVLIKKVINQLSREHVNPKNFVNAVKLQIPKLHEFVVKNQLVELDPSKPLKVRETPEYLRGLFGASVDAPGPFEAERETYYNVSPIDSWSKKDQKSYLREYNNYTLQILNIHEAIPGHYVQLVHSNKTSSLTKSILRNGTMIEGWAVYAERMMLEEGYGNDSAKLWLMYYKWYLRVVTNMLIDYEIHNGDLDKKGALALMIDEAFQEPAEAEKKWIRATSTQVQLASYFTGFYEIYQLRESMKKSLGGKFNLAEFNNRFLSFGSAPIGTIKALMTENAIHPQGM